MEMLHEMIGEATGFFIVSDSIFDLDEPLSPEAGFLYCYLRRLCNGKNQAFPSYKTISKRCGLKSDRRIKKAIDELVDRGLLHVENRAADSKKKELTSNLYTVFNRPSPKAGYIRLLQRSKPVETEGTCKMQVPHLQNAGTPPAKCMDPTCKTKEELNTIKNTQLCINTERESEPLCGFAAPPSPPPEKPEPEKEKTFSGDVSVNIRSVIEVNNQELKPTEQNPISKPVKQEPQILRNEYGEFNTVKLYKHEYDKLSDRFGPEVTGDYITRLDEYQKSKGKSFVNHYATILRWIGQDKREAEHKSVQYANRQPDKPKQNRFINFTQRNNDYSKYERLERAYLQQQLENNNRKTATM